jgi:hypothetical protein
MKRIIGIFFIMSFLLVSCTPSVVNPDGPKATVYKSALCGCCVGYIGFLQEHGFSVDTVVVEDMDGIKKKYGVPANMQSCHTTIIGDYVIEGHVPLNMVDLLLEEQPAIDGIALPNMPSGTPGMPGVKKGTWTIFALKDGEVSVWREI